ncbi:tetratricopeptide repeat protein [Oscillatoria sp. CS-180]|uniref:tetratricopeptide repeat protein n=1 Tax=Oscillatoria sp. CS-180 TaxID=3021720 RepID=UPI002330B220|nr:tetratricopeptide repeat protein [Oscillatoria sp. CS-180]MDB9529051.1 tetratricopeptide repeat protein [Oscillatoria sp. CS-180]
MAVKRNRWLVISVLFVAVGAFVALSILPFFSGHGNRPATATHGGGLEASNRQDELEAQARGYEAVLEREPDNQTAIQGLVDARIQLGDIAGVIEPLERLADLNPEVPEYRVLLGQARQNIGDLEGAADAYRTVLTQRPGDMNALQGLTALLIEQERPQAAVGLLQDTLEAAPQTNEVSPGTVDVGSVQLLLAQVFVEEEQFNDALRIYDEAIAADEEDFRPLLAKALVLRDIDRAPDAAVLFKQAEELAPDQYKDQVRQLATGGETPETLAPDVDTVEPSAAPETEEDGNFVE